METSEITTEEREELFPPLPGEDEPIAGLVHVIEAEKRVRYWKEKRDALEKESVEVLNFYRLWYERRQLRFNERIAFNMQQIAGYMDATGQTKIPTPEGTAYFKTITRKEWPEDEVLVAFAHRNEIPNAVRTKYSPDKKVISGYIERTGNVPEGYSEREERTLQIKQAGQYV